MSKKWYSMFVSLDPSADQNSAEGERAVASGSAAETVAGIAASVAAEPKFATPIAAGAGFEEIYHAAEIPTPAHGYTIMKVAEMLRSERIRALPAEVKRNSILLALDAAGVKIEEIIEDAVRRDRALDGYERVQQRALDELESQKNKENQDIQTELDRLVEQHNARIQGNRDELAREKERFYGWRLQKQQEEQKIADSVSPFVAENPITTGGATAAPRDVPAASKPGAQNPIPPKS